MTLGKWIGKFVGKWLGTVEELPPGFTSGTARITLRANGSVYGGTIPAFVSGSAQITISASGSISDAFAQEESSGGRLKVHQERIAKVQQYQKLLDAQKKAIEEKPVEVPVLLKPPEQLVINETALRYTQDALSLTDETQADALIKREKLDISPELVKKLAEIRQVAIEQVEIPDISPEHLALIRNNDDALAMILIYWGFEDEA